MISGRIGVAGAVLLGFLALSALTLATFAWHPLQRLERGEAAGQTGSGAEGQVPEELRSDDAEAEAPPAPVEEPEEDAPIVASAGQAAEGTAEKDTKARAGCRDEESELPPIEPADVAAANQRWMPARRSSTGWVNR